MLILNVLVTGDLSTETIQPLTAGIDGDDGSFEGSYWDNTAQTTTGPAPADPAATSSPPFPRPTQLFTCNTGSNKFMGRDDMILQDRKVLR